MEDLVSRRPSVWFRRVEARLLIRRSFFALFVALHSRLVHQPSNHRLLRHAPDPKQDQPVPAWIRSSSSPLARRTCSHLYVHYRFSFSIRTGTNGRWEGRGRVGSRRVGFGGAAGANEEGWWRVELTSSCGWRRRGGGTAVRWERGD